VLADIRYLAWAEPRYEVAPFNLALSGIPWIPAAEIDVDSAQLETTATVRRFADAIATWTGVGAEQVVPALGCSQALWLACKAIIEPGDEVLVEYPTYEPLWRVPEGLGAKVQRFGRRAQDGFTLDVSRLESALSGRRMRAVLVSAPHNPSGMAIPRATIAAAARVCERAGAWLVVDEVYAGLDDTARDKSPGTARTAGPNVIAVSSLTKCWGLAWARAGWLIGPPDIVRRAFVALRHMGWNGTPYAAFGLSALARIDALTARARSIVAGKRALVDEWVRARPRLAWKVPDVDLFGLVHVEGAGDLRAAIERAHAGHGVLVAPGTFFGVPEAFRLSWTVGTDKLETALELLDEHVVGRTSG